MDNLTQIAESIKTQIDLLSNERKFHMDHMEDFDDAFQRIEDMNIKIKALIEEYANVQKLIRAMHNREYFRNIGDIESANSTLTTIVLESDSVD